MALIKSVRGFTPEIGENCFLADNATIIGDVKIGNDCSIWFNTVLRGDVNSIRIGNGVNIQMEVSCIHYTRNRLLKLAITYPLGIMSPFMGRPSKIMHW